MTATTTDKKIHTDQEFNAVADALYEHELSIMTPMSGGLGMYCKCGHAAFRAKSDWDFTEEELVVAKQSGDRHLAEVMFAALNGQ